MDLRVTQVASSFLIDWGKGPRRCAVGKGGIAVKAREGDGITPRGRFAIREIFYRADRVPQLDVKLPLRAIQTDDGWCDEPNDPQYNRLVKLPYAASAETLWRADRLYDLVAVIGYNDDPVVPDKGSAIFLHLARPDYAPTAGCVALSYDDALEALAQLGAGDGVVIV